MTDQIEAGLEVALRRPSSTTCEVTRDSIHRFAIASGITAPIHHDVAMARAAGYRDIVAPAYFFVSLGLSMDQDRQRPELSAGGMALDDPLAEKQVVAGETQVEWLGQILAGDTIRIERTFVGAEHKRGRSGRFAIYTFRRDYSRNEELLIRETYARIAR